MAFCSKCGTEIKEGVKFCPSCGTAAGAQEMKNASTVSTQEKFQEVLNTPDTTGSYSQEDINTNKVMAILAYFGPLVLIPILAAPKSAFARFHANQGLVLLIVDIAYGIVTSILNAIFYAISWTLGSILSTILGLVWIVIGILAIIGIINAAQGKAKELPIIGKIKILK